MKRKGNDSGYVLLEALVALLIFSLGLLGMIGFQAASMKIATDSQFRTEAAMLSDELIAKMSVYQLTDVAADFASPNGSQFSAWFNNRVKGASRLPNAQVSTKFDYVPRATTTTLIVKLNISWSVPGSTTANGGREVVGTYETVALLF